VINTSSILQVKRMGAKWSRNPSWAARRTVGSVFQVTSVCVKSCTTWHC